MGTNRVMSVERLRKFCPVLTVEGASWLNGVCRKTMVLLSAFVALEKSALLEGALVFKFGGYGIYYGVCSL